MAKNRKSTEPGSIPSDEAPEGSSESSSASEIPRERIAERAYELYLARGGTDGQDWEDWLNAEREIMNGGRPPGEE